MPGGEAPDRACGAGKGEGEHIEAAGDGGYVARLCPCCDGYGHMTLRQLRRWHDDESHATPVAEFSPEDIERMFRADG